MESIFNRAVRRAGIIRVLLLISVLAGSQARGFRPGPKEGAPVILGATKYLVPHWGALTGRKQNGGYIEARDVKTNDRLWELRVYEIKYDPHLESDVQDIFIVSLKIEGKKLIVVNEKRDKFTVDLDTREVTPKGRVYGWQKKWWQFWRLDCFTTLGPSPVGQ